MKKSRLATSAKTLVELAPEQAAKINGGTNVLGLTAPPAPTTTHHKHHHHHKSTGQPSAPLYGLTTI